MTRVSLSRMLGAAAAVVGAVAAVVVLPALGARSAAPDFARDVAPIVRETCLGCHRDGGIAPFAFRSERDLASRAPLIVAALEQGRMPPWPPSARSPRYVGQGRRTLDDRERDTLIRWARSETVRPGGARRGTPVGTPPAAPNALRAGESRLRLRMPRSYLPSGSNASTDDYRCFLLDPKLARDAFATSAQIVPGAGSLVHHVILYRIAPSAVSQAVALDGKSPGPGWTCFGGPGVGAGTRSDPRGSLEDAGWIAAWAPGTGADRFRAGTGVSLRAGSRIVMQVHYNLLNGRAPDRSRALLTVAPASTGLTPLQTVLLPGPVELACAKGEQGRLCDRNEALFDLSRKYGSGAAFVPAGLLLLCRGTAATPTASAVSTCDRRITTPTTIHVAAGHMHLLGASIKLELNPGTSRSKVLLDIPRWNFHWQNAYMLEKPVQAEPGDVVRVASGHDVRKRTHGGHGIPKRPRYVLWGEGTTDEMCLGILQVTRG